MTDTSRSHGLWSASASAAPASVPLEGDIQADIAIVGGGFTGCSAALHAAVAGARVVLLEGREIGFGASGRNVGLVNAGLWVMPETLPKVLGQLHGERLLRQLGDAPAAVFEIVENYGIACEPVRHGTLHVAADAAGLEEIAERARQWQARGADVALLGADETARRIGSARYPGALLDNRAGTIQPLAYVRGLAAAAIAAGTSLYTDSPVTGFEDLGAAWRVSTSAGRVTAPQLIVATDVYAQRVGEALEGSLAREQVALPYFNLATPPLAPEIRSSILQGGEGVWDTRKILSSFRLDASGRLIFGSVGALRGTGMAVHAEWAKRTLARLFPQIGRIEFEHAWYGTIGMTENAAPRLHRLGRNAHAIGGYNGRGIAPGTSFGRDLARLALGSIGVEDLALQATTPAPAPLRKLRSGFFEIGAQIAHATTARL